MVWDGEYEAFGAVIRSNGTLNFTPSYTGKQFDQDTGLYYYNARFYDPTVGRFLNSDSARAGVNWYEYALDNPLKFVDLAGLDITTVTDHRTMQNDPNPYAVLPKGQVNFATMIQDNVMHEGCLAEAVAHIINTIAPKANVNASDLIVGRDGLLHPSFADKNGEMTPALIQKAIKSYTGKDYSVSRTDNIVENEASIDAAAQNSSGVFLIGGTDNLANTNIGGPHFMNINGEADNNGKLPMTGTSKNDLKANGNQKRELNVEKPDPVNDVSKLDKVYSIVPKATTKEFNNQVKQDIPRE